MLQRLQDFWPNLIRRPQRDEGEDRVRLLGPGEQDEDPVHDDEVDEVQLLENFHRLYWTRLIKVDDYD